jgi:chemotaxis protein MotB
MKKRKRRPEDRDNTERWLLTYADLITLLLGLFVILYASSKVDMKKFQEVMSAFGSLFGTDKSVGSVGTTRNSSPFPMSLPKFNGTRDLNDVERSLKAEIVKNGRANSVFITHNERGLTVHLLEDLLFETGKATLKTNSLSVLDSLAIILRYIPNDIRVEGHTDDVPIHNGLFASNWHLSVGRALNTAYYLIEKHSLVADRLSIVGYGEYRPLVTNDTAENRAKNRRVDIVIVDKNYKQQAS